MLPWPRTGDPNFPFTLWLNFVVQSACIFNMGLVFYMQTWFGGKAMPAMTLIGLFNAI
jgi:hypothetical protein